MGEFKYFTATLHPTLFTKRMLKHRGDVSEGSQDKLMARRTIVGRKVKFYHNGRREVKGTGLNEEDIHNSEILRLAHASLLLGEPVGDKRACYVDATKNPVEVWIYRMTVEEFLKTSKSCIIGGKLEQDFLLNEPIRKTMELSNERNERLFGRPSSRTPL